MTETRTANNRPQFNHQSEAPAKIIFSPSLPNSNSEQTHLHKRGDTRTVVQMACVPGCLSSQAQLPAAL